MTNYVRLGGTDDIPDIEDEVHPSSILDVCRFVSDCDTEQLERVVDSILIRRRSFDSFLSLAESRAYKLKLSTSSLGYNKFLDSEIPSTRVKAEPSKEVWFGIYRKALTLVVGGSGVGKSSMAYNIALHGALGKSLWGVEWSDGPERILYIDPENVGTPRDSKLSNITHFCGIERSDNLIFNDGDNINLADAGDIRQLQDYIIERKITGVIIEPLINAFETKNESDNAEAMNQMKPLINMMQKTGVWIMLFHHPGGTGENGIKIQGRGATARHGLSYVAMTIETPTPPGTGKTDDDYNPGEPRYREDVVRVKVNKNRPGGQYYALYLKMMGNDGPDTFERIRPDQYWSASESGGSTLTSEQRARAMVLECMGTMSNESTMTAVTVRSLMEEVKKIKGAPGDGSIRKAIAALSSGEDAPLTQYAMKLPGSPNAVFWSGMDANAVLCPGTGSPVIESLGGKIYDFSIGET